ncbi:MAG: hypothetical protein FJZ56_02535 [Chlamydiae bacterium]|nr:hypothetical protein [Chlamydiota bacterium]
MSDEFEKIMEFLSLASSEKEAKLDDIFQNSIEFFDHFKHVQQTGSKEEVEKMKIKLEKMYEKIQEESRKAKEKSGLSSEEIKELASNPQHFTKKQWEFLQEARAKLEIQNKELLAQTEKAKSQRMQNLSKTKKTHKTRKKDWLRS